MILKFLKTVLASFYFFIVLAVLFLYEICMFLNEIDAYAHLYHITITQQCLLLLLFLTIIYITINNRFWDSHVMLRFWKRWLCVVVVISLPLHILYFEHVESLVFVMQYVRLFVLPACLYSFFYIQFKKNRLPIESIVVPYFVFWIIAAFFYFKNIGVIVALRETQNLLYSVNFVYYLVLALPILFLTKFRYYIIPIILTAVAVMLSGKRGAIIVMLASFLFHPILKSHILGGGKATLKSIVSLIILIIGIYLLSVYNEELFTSAVERITSLKTDSGSGRTEIWGNILNAILNSSLLGILFGHGFESTKLVTDGYTSHNDILEVFYNYGIIALAIYLSLYKALISKLKIVYLKHTELAFAFFSSIVFFVILSNVSHLISYPHFMLFIPFWAYVYSDIKLKK